MGGSPTIAGKIYPAGSMKVNGSRRRRELLPGRVVPNDDLLPLDFGSVAGY
jgi:hypothetical protein